MKIIIMIITILLLVINFMAAKSNEADEVEKLKVTSKIEFFLNGRLEKVEDSFCIYQWRGAKIFEFNYHETLEDLERILNDEVKYQYFGYDPGSNIGYIFANLSDTGYSRTCNADSMLKGYAHKSVDYFTIVNNGKLIQKFDDPSKAQRTYVYVPLQKPDALTSDTVYLIFSDILKNVNYSFSKSADSVSKSKLVEAKFLFNETFSNNLRIPKREIFVRIDKIKATNSEDIRYFLTHNKKYFKN